MRIRIFNVISHKAYDSFMIFVIILSLIPLCFHDTNSIFIAIEYITTTIFIIDYILRWITANHLYSRLAYIRYPFGFFAVIDLISILPTFAPVSAGLRLLRLLRLAKALKTLKILRYSKSIERIIRVMHRERRPLLAVCALACGYVVVSAMIMFQVEPDSFGTFFDALYWAMVTLTTVGYGDVYPHTEIGRLVSMLSACVGIAIVALPTSIITAGYTAELNEENKS